MKAGIKTTEFWVTVCVQIVGLLAAFGVFTPEQTSGLVKMIPMLVGLVTMAVSQLGYAVSRGNTKMGSAVK